MENELYYVFGKLRNHQYTVLSKSISINRVLKIHICGDLNSDGFELGYLVMPKGSGIKTHTHQNEIERYKLVDGLLKVNGVLSNTDICTLNHSHGIDPVSKLTIVQTCKINKLCLDLIGKQNDDAFNQFINTVLDKQEDKILKKNLFR